jgi:hypothetical protein
MNSLGNANRWTRKERERERKRERGQNNWGVVCDGVGVVRIGERRGS